MLGSREASRHPFTCYLASGTEVLSAEKQLGLKNAQHLVLRGLTSLMREEGQKMNQATVVLTRGRKELSSLRVKDSIEKADIH